jgi:hypothetical protein
MPDLSPDTSIYQHVGQGNQLDLGRLLATAHAARELQSQQAESDALRASGGDPTAALSSLMQPGASGYVNAGTVSHLTQAAGEKAKLDQWYMGQAATGIGSLLTNPHATIEDWHNIRPLLERYLGPRGQGVLDAVEHAATKDGKLDHDSLVAVHNFATLNAGLPQGPTVKGAGVEYTPTAGGALYGGSTVPTPKQRPETAPAAGGRPSPSPSQPTAPKQDAAAEAENEVRAQYGGYGVNTGAVANPSQAVQQRWSDSGKEYSHYAASNYAADVAPINKALDILQKNPNATGRGLGELNSVKNLLHSFGFIKDEDMGKVVDFETLSKHMANIANQGSMNETDARLWQTIAGSASPDKLGDTNKAVLRFALGLRNMQQVAFSEFRKRSGGPNGMPIEYFSDWKNAWLAKQVDPMAFVWKDLNEDEQRAYLKEHYYGKDQEQLNRFKDSINVANRNL